MGIHPMWQTMYDLHRLRMRELEAAADRRRRWALEDGWNDRTSAGDPAPGRARASAARAAASISRGAARIALWLDCRVAVEARGERVLRDA
jgi:hypothetical protein